VTDSVPKDPVTTTRAYGKNVPMATTTAPTQLLVETWTTTAAHAQFFGTVSNPATHFNPLTSMRVASNTLVHSRFHS
jgi:hypothetical protein